MVLVYDDIYVMTDEYTMNMDICVDQIMME